jgi:hypothetical protein
MNTYNVTYTQKRSHPKISQILLMFIGIENLRDVAERSFFTFLFKGCRFYVDSLMFYPTW